MDFVNLIFAIINVIGAILEIILFFKLWKMTSNVESLLMVVKDRIPKPSFSENEKVRIDGMEGIWSVVKINENGTIKCNHKFTEKDFNSSMLHKI